MFVFFPVPFSSFEEPSKYHSNPKSSCEVDDTPFGGQNSENFPPDAVAASTETDRFLLDMLRTRPSLLSRPSAVVVRVVFGAVSSTALEDA